MIGFGRIKQALFDPLTEKFLLNTLIFLLPTQLGRHFWPDFSYLFSLKIDYFSPTLYLWDILMLLLFLVWLLKKPIINKTAGLLIGIFLIGQILSVFASMNPGVSIVRLWQYLIVGMFGIYIASQHRDFLNRLRVPIVLAIIFQSVLGILQFLMGGSLGLWILGERTFNLSTPGIATFDWQGQIFLRPYATLPHPNVFAAFILFYSLIYLKTVAKISINQGLFLIFGLIAVVLSFSRSVLTIVLTEFLFFMRSRIFILVMLGLVLYPFLSIRFDSLFDFDSMSLTRREELAENAILFFNESPLLGVGLNNYIVKSAFSELVSGTTRFFQPVHNIFLLLLSETGLVGFLSFALFFTYPLIVLFRKRHDSGHFYANLFIIIFFLGFLDHYFLTLVQGQRLLFLVWGLSMLELFSAKVKDHTFSNRLANNSKNL